jgi:hypothetical protein
MPYPSTGSKTELQAINQILASVGQAPVTTLDTDTVTTSDGQTVTVVTNPDIAIAYDTLQEVSREVQAEGWSFNKEYDYLLNPDSVTKYIEYPQNALQVDLSNNPRYASAYAYRDVVRRNDRLYDKINKTDTWDDPIYCDILWWRPWTDLPAAVQDYITARAASIFASRVIGDPTQYQILQQKEAYTRAMALEYECNQGDYSFFGSPREGSAYQSYQPFKTLQRY